MIEGESMIEGDFVEDGFGDALPDYSPVGELVLKNNIEELSKILNSLVDEKEKWSQYAEEALSYAISFNRPEVVDLLITSGVSVHTRDSAGRTALIVTADFFTGAACDDQSQINKMLMVESLIKAGSDINVRDREGESALDSSLIPGNIVSSLLSFEDEDEDEDEDGDENAWGEQVICIDEAPKYLSRISLLLFKHGAETYNETHSIHSKMIQELPKFVKIGENKEGRAVYRQAEGEGDYVKTLQEQREIISRFKKEEKTSELVALSIFNNEGFAQAMGRSGLAEYLKMQDIAHASSASGIRDENKIVVNGTALQGIYQNVSDKVDEEIKSRLKM